MCENQLCEETVREWFWEVRGGREGVVFACCGGGQRGRGQRQVQRERCVRRRGVLVCRGRWVAWWWARR